MLAAEAMSTLTDQPWLYFYHECVQLQLCSQLGLGLITYVGYSDSVYCWPGFILLLQLSKCF